MRILVTGGTGRLGRAVVPALAGEDVQIMSRRGHVVADLSTGEGVAAAVAGVDVVVHLATGNTGRRDVAAACRLVTAARRAGVAHLVYVSIVGVDRVPNSYYRGKLAVERLLAESGLPHTILRTTQFHDLVRAYLAAVSRLPVVPVPDLRVQPIDVRDVATHLAPLVTGPPRGRVEDLGGPEVLSFETLARTYGGKGVVRYRLPGRTFRAYRDGGHLTGTPGGEITFAQYVDERR
ncbi:SDR family oxidoreductase [Actinophytocola xanthii]|uniref:NAD(P)-binding domain-containing protein n=1 Tax=Actinophytocola xanthii TaxID=1912961 RepID=A0A1Q8C7P1_9PSEU|nr:SDR family oxidoreductase [Actinophytocola xanthii]OLF10389.1 hypothetical protein BU204_31815 [Actinophytocola xanthii]